MADIVLKKGRRYRYKGITFERGKPMEVPAKDRNYLVRTGFFRDYVETKAPEFEDLPEEDATDEEVAELPGESTEPEGPIAPEGAITAKKVTVRPRRPADAEVSGDPVVTV